MISLLRKKIWLATDMTELEQSEETKRQILEQQRQLRESHSRLELATEAGGIGTWEYNIVDNELKWDEKCKTLFGLSGDDEITYEKLMRLILPDDRTTVDKIVKECMEHQGVYEVEYRANLPDGSFGWFYSKGKGIFDESGKCVRLAGVSLNITERREREERLKQLTAELKRSNYDLEQFAYIVSHDLREPLRAVTGFLGLLQERYNEKLDEKANKYINFAVGGAARMDALLSGLLDYSRVGTRGYEKKEYPIDDLITKVLQN